MSRIDVPGSMPADGGSEMKGITNSSSSSGEAIRADIVNEKEGSEMNAEVAGQSGDATHTENQSPDFGEDEKVVLENKEIGVDGIEGGKESEYEKSPEERMGSIENDLNSVEERLKKLEEKRDVMREDSDRINTLRGELGGKSVDAGIDASEIEMEIENLMKTKEELEGKKEDVSAEQSINDILTEMQDLSPAEIKIIIETGKTSKGENLKTKDGRELKPDIAKKLAEFVGDGIGALTSAIISILLAVVKGALRGIFEATTPKQNKE